MRPQVRKRIAIAAALLAAPLLIAAGALGPALIKATSIELGSAGTTDTTLTRASAGVVAVEGVSMLSTAASGVQTFLTTPSSANLGSMVTDDLFLLSDAELGALAGTTAAADKAPYYTSTSAASTFDMSSAMRTWHTTSSSANLASVLTDETGGSGVAVFNSSPALTTPTISAFELGASQTDTTFTRGAAGQPEVEGLRVFWQCGSSIATTSGDDIELSAVLPTAARNVTVQLLGVSISGTDDINIVLGDAGGYETTGYTSIGFSNTTGIAGTAGFLINGVAASELYTGRFEMTSRDNLTWVSNHWFYKDDTTDLIASGAGSKATSQTTDRIRLSTSGSNTFDAGSAFVCWSN